MSLEGAFSTEHCLPIRLLSILWGYRTGKEKTGRAWQLGLEPVDLYGLGIEFEPFFLVDQEFLDIFALIPLELDHLAHLSIVDDGAIAGKFLLDDLENLLLIEFLREALNRGQSLTTIALLNPYMDIVLRLFGVAGVFVSFGEGVEGLEVFDGHKPVVCRNEAKSWVLWKNKRF